MSDKKVKIVKRAERVSRKPNKSKAARKSARDMVNNVTNWVSEFQERQRDETAKAVESLIRSRQQQPNEA
ncbi:MAG TPA: hypothetical protein VNG71_11410 [Pyrinomonadaceae bacterium]|nr:hypothetical protein [Pyrinomonadaceae bacterium]